MKKNRIVLLIVLAIVVIVVAGFGIVCAKHIQKSRNDKAYKTASDYIEKTSTQDEQPSLARMADDVSRKNDASRLLAAAAEFISNNNGSLPTAWQEGKLIDTSEGVPSDINLTVYKEVFVEKGVVPVPGVDRLELITGVTCGDGGQVKVSTSSRAIVARYQLSSGYQCTEL